VRVEHLVDDVTAITGAGHQPQIPQDAQLMGHRWLGHSDRVGEFPHRGRTRAEPGEDPHPAGGGKPAHDAGDLLRTFRVDLAVRADAMLPTHANMLTCTFSHVNEAADGQADTRP